MAKNDTDNITMVAIFINSFAEKEGHIDFISIPFKIIVQRELKFILANLI